MFGDFWGSLKNPCFLSQTGQAIFGKLWGTFYFNIWSHCSLNKIEHGCFVSYIENGLIHKK